MRNTFILSSAEMTKQSVWKVPKKSVYSLFQRTFRYCRVMDNNLYSSYLRADISYNYNLIRHCLAEAGIQIVKFWTPALARVTDYKCREL